MKQIAFLGTGAMGRRMIRQLLNAGHVVKVWNRSTQTAKELAEFGAEVCDNIETAVKDADCIISMVRDDAASAEVWIGSNGAINYMPDDAIAVECSTVSLPHIRQLQNTFQHNQKQFIDAPLAGSRPQAEAAQLIFFVGAETAGFNAIEPVLSSMGSHVHHAGAPGSGVVTKLMVNALLGTQLALMAELLGFARESGVNAAHALHMIASTPVCSTAAKVSAEAMLNKQFAPAFPIELVVKDLSLIQDSVTSVQATAPLCKQVKTIYEKAVDSGFAADNITAVAQLYEAP